MSDKDKSKEEVIEEESSFEEMLEEALETPGAERPPLDIREIPLEEIGEIQNVRPAYHGIEGLAETMHLQGQLQPCVVRPAAEGADHGKPYELVVGYRRRRAAEYLQEKGIEGWDSLRCEVRELDDDRRIRQTIIENFQRENLSPVAEARAMHQLKYSVDPPLRNVAVARELGCDPSHVSHRLKMLVALSPQKPEPEVYEEQMKEKVSKGEEEKKEKSDKKETPPSSEATDDIQEETEESGLDILQLVDEGDISASTAEVIASLEKRDDQEKLAELVVRNDWGVKKAASWARNVQEKVVDEGPPSEEIPIEMVQIEDAVPLASLRPKADVSDDEIEQILLYAILRNGMDREMLEYLSEEMNVPYKKLWEYCSSLSSKDRKELLRRMALRYVSAAHRWFSLESSLKDQIGVPEDAPAGKAARAEELQARLPKATDAPVSSTSDPAEALKDLLDGGEGDE